MITLRPDQDKAVRDMRAALSTYDSILFRGPTGMGKCLGKGTPILMHDGTVLPVERVKVGDKLMGPDGNSRTVLSLARGHEEMFRVKQKNGDDYVVNKSHILSLKQTSDHKPKKWLGHKAINISVADYLTKTQNFKNLTYGWKAPADFLPGEELRVDPYFLGLWLGDGHSRCPTITTGDREIASFMYAYAKSLGMKIRIEPNSKNSERLHLIAVRRGAGNPVTSALRSYNLILNKHVPLDYIRASRADRLELLAGFLDADGHLSNRSVFEVTQKSEVILDGIIFMARSLGLKVSKTKVNKTCGNNGVSGVYYRANISGPTHKIPTKVARKRAPAPSPNKDHMVCSIELEPLGVGEYFGFEIDGDRLFMLGDFTVTHNTVVASYIAQQAALRGNRVIFGVHRIELATQTAKTFDRFGIKYGFIAADKPANPFALVQIASADTLRNRPQLLKNTKLFVPDEAHLWASKTRGALIQGALDEGAKVIGLSATPERLDGKPLDMFQHIVQGPSEAFLIKNGFLSQYRAFAPHRPDLSGLHTRMGDYVVSELEERFDKPAIYGDVIDSWKKYAAGMRTMVFAISRQHGQHITDAYNEAGVPAVYIDGSTPAHERKQRIEAFADGRALILVSIQLCIEGFDLSAQVNRDVPVEAVQLLNPTKSLARARQMMGRALRPKPNPAIILDHVGIILNADGTVNHGFPDDVREWSLAGRPRVGVAAEVEFSITTCMDCFGAYKSSLRVCPHCQSERQARPRAIEEREAELAEIKRKDDEEALKRDVESAIKTARSLDDLAMVAVEYGKDPKWLVGTSRYRKRNKITYEQAKKAMFDATGRFKQARSRSDARDSGGSL